MNRHRGPKIRTVSNSLRGLFEHTSILYLINNNAIATFVSFPQEIAYTTSQIYKFGETLLCINIINKVAYPVIIDHLLSKLV